MCACGVSVIVCDSVCVYDSVCVHVCVCVCACVCVPVVVVLLCTDRALQRIPGAVVLALLQALALALVLASVLTAGPGGLAELGLPTGGAHRLGLSSAGLPAGAGEDGTDSRHSGQTVDTQDRQ